jgi:hypothetical protein
MGQQFSNQENDIEEIYPVEENQEIEIPRLMFGGIPILQNSILYENEEILQETELIPPEFSEIIILNNYSNLIKNSIELIPLETGDFQIKGEIDVKENHTCKITILFGNEETSFEQSNIPSIEINESKTWYSPLETPLDLIRLEIPDIIIHLKCNEVSQFTFLKVEDFKKIKVNSQKIKIKNEWFVVEDIYFNNDNEEESKCVVCINEISNCCILPCKHQW